VAAGDAFAIQILHAAFRRVVELERNDVCGEFVSREALQTEDNTQKRETSSSHLAAIGRDGVVIAEQRRLVTARAGVAVSKALASRRRARLIL
jgi:hypothetical protein